MRAVTLSIVSALVLSVPWSAASACEKCPTELVLDVDAAARKAPWVLVGKRITPAGAGEMNQAQGLESIEFQVERVLKSDPGVPVKAGARININFMDGMCTYGFMLEDQGRVVIFAGSRDADGVYRPVHDGCGATHVSVAADGTVQVAGAPLSLDGFAQRLTPKTRRTLTLKPDELVYDEAAMTATFKPDRGVRRAAYVTYILELAGLESVLGKRPTVPTAVVVEVGPVERSTYRPGPEMPQPDGGFQNEVYRGTVVGRP